MAPLTWREVSAPNFSGVADSQRLAATLLDNGFGALSNALAKFQTNRDTTRKDAATSNFLAGISRFTDAGSMQEALRSGTALSGVNPADVSPEALKYAIESQRHLLGNDTVRLNNAGQGIANDTNQFRLLTAQRNDQLQWPKTLLEDKKFWEQQGITEQAQGIAFKAINENATPAVAIRSIQENAEIKDPRTKAQAIQVIQAAAGDNVFLQADPAEQLLMTFGQVPSIPSSGSGNGGLFGLLAQHEGAGNFDTLFGHSQRPGGRFEGVRPSQMTLDQLDEFDKEYGPWVKGQLAASGQEARIATPAGFAQIVGSTRRQVAKEMGLPGNTVFTPEVQVAMMQHIADKALAGPRTMQGKMEALRGQWEGFKNVPDAQLASAITAYENGDRSVLSGLTQAGPGVPAPGSAAQAGALTPSASALIEEAAGPVTTPEVASLIETPTRTLTTTSPTGEQRAEERTQGTGIRDILMSEPQQNTLSPAHSLVPTGEGDQLLAAVVPPTSAQAPAQTSSGTQTPPAQTAQDLLNQSVIDRGFNTNAALMAQVQAAQSSTETAAQVAARLVGEGGAIPGGNSQAVLQAIQETIQMSGGKFSPAMAGAVVANNSESRDLTSLWDWVLPGSWVNGDRFSSGEENQSSATRTNMDGVARDLKQLGLNVDGSIDLSRGASQLKNQQTSALSQQQVAAAHGQLLLLQQEAANIVARIRGGQNTKTNQDALQRVLGLIARYEAALQQIGTEPSGTTIFSGAGDGRPNR